MLDSDTLKPIAFLCAKALQESVLKLNSSDTVEPYIDKKINLQALRRGRADLI